MSEALLELTDRLRLHRHELINGGTNAGQLRSDLEQAADAIADLRAQRDALEKECEDRAFHSVSQQFEIERLERERDAHAAATWREAIAVVKAMAEPEEKEEEDSDEFSAGWDTCAEHLISKFERLAAAQPPAEDVHAAATWREALAICDVSPTCIEAGVELRRRLKLAEARAAAAPPPVEEE